MGTVTKMGKWGLEVQPDNIHKLLKEHNRWVCWKAMPQPDGRIGKKPMMPAGRAASVTNEDTWSSFKACYTAYTRDDSISGVGFVMTGFKHDITIIDLDKCYDPIDEANERAQAIVDAAHSYTEISPSNRGMRIITMGDAGAFINNHDGVEVYTQESGRFVTLTGHIYQQLTGIRRGVSEALVDTLEQYRPVVNDEASQDPMEDTPSELKEVLTQLMQRDHEMVHYKPWLDLGMGLHHQFDGHPDGLDMWHELSAELTNYEPDELDHKWDSFGKGGKSLTLRTMYDRAKAQGIRIKPHHKPVSADAFPDLDDDDDGPVTFEDESGTPSLEAQAKHTEMLMKPAAGGLMTLGDLADQKPPHQLIEDVFAVRQTSQISGEPGAGKTFLAMELCYAVARGEDAFGKRTDKSPVLYLPYEGVSAMASRVRAWEARGRHLPDNFHIATGMPSLADTDKWLPWVLTQLVAIGKRPLVVIDTLAAALPGVNTSDEERMGAIIGSLRNVADKGCHVCHIHHPPKGGVLTGQKSRGSGVIEGDLDSQIWVTKTDGHAKSFEVTKQRGLGSYGWGSKFVLKTVPTSMMTNFGRENGAYLSQDVTEEDSKAPEDLQLSDVMRGAIQDAGGTGIDGTQWYTIVNAWIDEHWPTASPDAVKRRRQQARKHLGGEFVFEPANGGKVQKMSPFDV